MKTTLKAYSLHGGTLILNRPHPRTTSARAAVPLLTVLALYLFAATCANADSGHSRDREVRFTGPLVTGAPPLPKGLLNVEPYLINTRVVGVYDRDGRRHDVDGVPDSWTLAVPMAYGVADRLTLGATFSAGLASTLSGNRSWQMGDTGVSMSYLLAKRDAHNATLTVALKQNLPTGRHDRLDRDNLAEATGSGAATTRVALLGQAYFLPRRNLRARINVSWRLPGSHASLDGESAYGTSAGFDGRVELQGASQASLGVEYGLNPRWVLATDLVYERDHGAHLHGTIRSDAGPLAYDRALPSSWRASLAPAVEYHWNERIGLIAGAFVSFDGRNSAAVFSPQVALNMVF